MYVARGEYEKILAQRRIDTALTRRPPPSANYVFEPGQWVYAYRETSKLWTGPHLLAEVNGKAAYVHLGERTCPRHFNIAQLKPSFTEQNVPPDESIGSAPSPFLTRFTEIIPSSDPRAALFDEAKQQEILGLIDRGTFRLAVLEEIPPKPNVVPSRYVH
jgi:hypothetical protein